MAVLLSTNLENLLKTRKRKSDEPDRLPLELPNRHPSPHLTLPKIRAGAAACKKRPWRLT
jgi:hypothetical protein